MTRVRFLADDCSADRADVIRGERTAGDFLLRPFTLAAIVALLVNDHLLKGIGPPIITGKLSDLTGLVLASMLLVTWAELIHRPRTIGQGSRRRRAWTAAVVVGVGFALVKLYPWAAVVYGDAVGWVRWVTFAPLHILDRAGVGRPRRVMVAHDLTDLTALPALWLSYRVMSGDLPRWRIDQPWQDSSIRGRPDADTSRWRPSRKVWPKR